MRNSNRVLRHLILGLLLLFVSCGTILSQTAVTNFNDAYNDRDYEALKETMSPNLVVIDYNGDTVAQNRTDYTNTGIHYTVPFGTKWKILEMEQKGDTIFTHESDSSSLNQFLYDGPLEFRYEYNLKNNQIVKLKYDSLPGYAKLEQLAATKFQTLFMWIATKHPEKFQIAQEATEKGAIELNLLILEYLKGGK